MESEIAEPAIERVLAAFIYPLPWSSVGSAPQPSGSFEPISAADPDSSSLGSQLRRLKAIGFEEGRIRRFVYRPDHAGLRLDLAPSESAANPKVTAFISIFDDYDGIGSLVINFELSGTRALTGNVIALIHSADGRPIDDEPFGIAGGEVHVSHAGKRLRSIQCAAHAIMAEFRKGVKAPLVPVCAEDGDPFGGVDELKKWHEHPFSKPRRCIELRSNALSHEAIGSTYAKAIYGMMAGDEGWPTYPAKEAQQRIQENYWRSRDFFQVQAFGRTALLINNKHAAYVSYQDAWWTTKFGYISSYYHIDYSIGGLDHGVFRVLENCVASVTLQERVRLSTLTYLNTLKHRRDAIAASPYGHDEASVTSSIHRMFSPWALLSDVRNVVWLTRSRARIFQTRIRVVDDVRLLTTLRVREFGDLAKLVRGEQGVEEASEIIRARLAEVDGEFNVLSSSSNNYLLMFLAVLGAVFAFTSLVWSGPGFISSATNNPILADLIGFFHRQGARLGIVPAQIGTIFAETFAALVLVAAIAFLWFLLASVGYFITRAVARFWRWSTSRWHER